ncbi:hypothetical protein J2W20_000480 [Sinomonas atrocyanea]|uniref:ANTAR domain-containing protein n=1 Tax=Sinomonas atrocyanea TaxID=37927 RepID=UPI0027865534|nr:ANTAR domain-containing protein [Sinomonas atrocyanea]MDQ0258605.1 hypothetical protein [Sinomonas atrocyanea]
MRTYRVGPPERVDFLDLLITSDTLPGFLGGAAEVAAARLSAEGEPVHCGILVVRERAKDLFAGSVEGVMALDEAQAWTAGGPCREAALREERVRVGGPPLRDEDADYLARMTAAGFRCTLAVPIPLPAPLGAAAALGAYTAEPDALTGARAGAVARVAGKISRPLALALRLAEAWDRAADLAAAMESRTAIDLAAGVIMAQSRCTQSQAVDLLKSASISRNTKLRDVAEQIVCRFDPAGPTTAFN